MWTSFWSKSDGCLPPFPCLRSGSWRCFNTYLAISRNLLANHGPFVRRFARCDGLHSGHWGSIWPVKYPVYSCINLNFTDLFHFGKCPENYEKSVLDYSPIFLYKSKRYSNPSANQVPWITIFPIGIFQPVQDLFRPILQKVSKIGNSNENAWEI